MHSSHAQFQPSLVPNVPVATPISAATSVPGTPPVATAAPIPIPHERVLGHRRLALAQNADVRELNVSGVRVLLALGGAIGLTALLLWGVVRDWLFAQ